MLQIQATTLLFNRLPPLFPPPQQFIKPRQTRNVRNNNTLPVIPFPMTKKFYLKSNLKRLINSNQSIIFSRLQQKSQYTHPYPYPEDTLVNYEMSEESIATREGERLQQECGEREKEAAPRTKIMQRPDPPEKPEPGDCCGSGCVRCIWDIYYEELDEYNKLVKEYESQRQAGLKD